MFSLLFSLQCSHCCFFLHSVLIVVFLTKCSHCCFFYKGSHCCFFCKVFSLLFFLQSVLIVVFLQSVLIVGFFNKVFSLVFLQSVLIVVFFTKCSHCCFFHKGSHCCFSCKVLSLLFFLLQSVLIDLFLFFEKFFVCLYDIKNNYTRKCCARNSWFFSTILHFYHIRPSTNFWLFVCCNPTD